MNRVSAGRALMGDSLGFHLLFVIFGIGLPLLISLLELYALITHRPKARALARSWSHALVILFIAGAVSGTIVSLQFSLLWPRFMIFVSKTVGIAFALEGTAFLVEAVFLSVYMLSWDRFKPWVHWLCSIPLVLGSLTSGVFITSVNAFMNQPAGFTLGSDGQPTNIHVAKALFNPATFTEVTHSMVAYVCATTLVLLAIYAWLYHKKKHIGDRTWMIKALVGLAIMALITGSLVGILGDRSGKYLAKYEPYKLAAAEGLQQTQTHAPLIIGGIVLDNQIRYGLKIPSLLSLLATNHFGAEVTGLQAFPPSQRPPLVIHYFFDGMVASGILIVLLPALFLILWKWRRAWATSKLMLLLLVACGILGIIATEFGWLLTELGRQPYVIYGYLRTADALTTSQVVVRFAYIFPIFFIFLLGLTAMVLRKTMNNDRVRHAHL